MNDDFLIQPLIDHPEGLHTALEDAAAQISARVESWSQEVAA